MATRRWLGTAPKIAQVQEYVLAGTWVATETITFTRGTVTRSVVVGSTVIATILNTIRDEWNNLTAGDYPSFDELTASNDGATKFKLTADTKGKPFAMTLSTNSAAGTIDGGTSSAGTTATANSGPNSWSVAANWSGSTVPVNSDDVIIDEPIDILYGLAQSAVTLTSLTIGTGFGNKSIGLSEHSGSSGWAEVLDTYLAIGATTITIECASTRIKINTGAVQTTVNVHDTGTGTETGVPAFLFRGTHASNAMTAVKGQIGASLFASETATLATLRIGSKTTVASDVSFTAGTGLSITNLDQNGGDVVLRSATTTIDITAGTLSLMGSGAHAAIEIGGGTLYYQSSGTLTTANLRNDGHLNFDRNSLSRTVTNCTVYSAAAKITDNFNSVTWTNGVDVYTPQDPNIKLGKRLPLTYTPSAV